MNVAHTLREFLTPQPPRAQSLAQEHRAITQRLARARRFAICRILTCLWLVTVSLQAAPTAELLYDLLVETERATVTDAIQFAVRRPGEAGERKLDAIFAHPTAPGRNARVQFALSLPQMPPGDRVLLAFEIAIADGVKLNEGADGVEFIAALDGKEIFRRVCAETKWSSHAIDLTDYVGGARTLTFETAARANTAYDWALWGAPRIVALRDSTLTNFPASTTINAGFVAANLQPNQRLTIASAAAESITVQGNGGWVATDFLFTNAAPVTISLDGASAVPVLLGEYAPMLEIVRFGPADALLTPNAPTKLSALIRNKGRGIYTGGAATVTGPGIDRATLQAPRLNPNAEWEGAWAATSPRRLGTVVHTLNILATTPPVSASVESTIVPAASRNSPSLENDRLRFTFVRNGRTIEYAEVWTRTGQLWFRSAIWKPFFRISSAIENRATDWNLPVRDLRIRNNIATLSAESTDRDGVLWRGAIEIHLSPGAAIADVKYTWRADQDRRIYALWGPDLKVGEGTSGAAKTWGLFPGLEYLYLDERSSNPRDFSVPLNDRRTPHPNKVTVPLMAITLSEESRAAANATGFFYTPDSAKDQNAPRLKPATSPDAETTIALTWDPQQSWAADRQFPSPRFASPNFDQGERNHRMALFLPSALGDLPENATRAEKPITLAAGKPFTLTCQISIASGTVLTALSDFVQRSGGTPPANAWPHSFDEAMRISREGFLNTVWDANKERWSHCIGWAGSHAPGFATLLLHDHALTQNSAAAERVARSTRNLLRDAGPEGLVSPANCHILQWEFPFYHGDLPKAFAAVDRQMKALIASQQSDGGWRYEPADRQQASLGERGDSVLGTSANKASTIMRYARITGDRAAIAAGEKALAYLEQFRLPRGGQTWECPMYEPDILAAAYAIRAYVEGYRATGNNRWLHNALYWAETGTVFQYLWTLPNKPMMLGASIPVFGSTFYNHSWLGVPVQWCGLVYSYQLIHLLEALRDATPQANGSPLKLSTSFTPADYQRMVELIVSSALHQQFKEGDKIGAYPDSITDFETRNPAFINPEDIVVNVLALRGADPDIKTARASVAGQSIVISAGAKISAVTTNASGFSFAVESLPNSRSHGFIAAPKPRALSIDGKSVVEQNEVTGEMGWSYEAATQRTHFIAPKGKSVIGVEW